MLSCVYYLTRVVPLVAILSCFTFLGSCGGVYRTGEQKQYYADTLFTGGTIYLDVETTASALAVKDGLVVAVGNKAENLAGPETNRIDMNGAYVFPGFHDNHTHLLGGSFVSTQLYFNEPCTMSEIVAKTQKYIEANPGKSWVVGFGWRLRPDEKASGVALDAIASETPIMLTDASGHSALVNSTALERAGIAIDTPNPQGGEIVRDPDTGEPTGHLKENAMVLISSVMMPDLSDQEMAAPLPATFQLFTQSGITGISEILGAPGMDLTRPWLFSQLERKGQLPLRIHYYVPIFSFNDLERAVSLGDRYDSQLVRLAGGKIWVDGAMGSAEAWTSFPHVQDSNSFGTHYLSAKQLQRLIAKAEALRLPLKFHVNGDAATESVLKALESVVRDNGELNVQHSLEHLGFVNEDQLRRIEQLELVASIQPGFWGGNHALPIHVYGAKRFAEAYDYHALEKAGVPLAIGSDWPVTPTPDVLGILRVGTAPREKGSLRIETIIRGFTEGSARSVGRPDLGQLHVGFAADMVIFDRNPLKVKTEEINDLKVVEVWVAGVRIK